MSKNVTLGKHLPLTEYDLMMWPIVSQAWSFWIGNERLKRKEYSVSAPCICLPMTRMFLYKKQIIYLQMRKCSSGKKFASSLLYKYILDLYAWNTGKRFHVWIFIDRDLFKIKIFLPQLHYVDMLLVAFDMKECKDMNAIWLENDTFLQKCVSFKNL